MSLTLYSTALPPSTVYETVYEESRAPLLKITPLILMLFPVCTVVPVVGCMEVRDISGSVGFKYNSKLSKIK